MKPLSSRPAGFTLVELLTVIAIIGLLAGLTMATMSSIQNHALRNRTRAEISALSVAIESYKNDNGDYPRDTATTDKLNARTDTNATLQNYKDASLFLYVALSGDTDKLGTPGDVSTSTGEKAKIYFPFKANMLSPKESTPYGSVRTSAVQAIADPFRNAYGYSTIGSAVTTGSAAPTGTNGYNPTFDLWSTVDPSQTGATLPGTWISNW